MLSKRNVYRYIKGISTKVAPMVGDIVNGGGNRGYVAVAHASHNRSQPFKTCLVFFRFQILRYIFPTIT